MAARTRAPISSWAFARRSRPIRKLTLAIPVKLGLSLNDYYEGYSDTFGFFDIGLQASVPLASGKGARSSSTAASILLWLGDNLKVLNDDDGFKPVGLIGFTFTY